MELLIRIFDFIGHIDPKIYELQKDLEFYQLLFMGVILLSIIFGLIIFLQRRTIFQLRGGERRVTKKQKVSKKKSSTVPQQSNVTVKPKELPDPGLIFKYSLAKEHVMEKLITIGQTDGNIKTFSTEIIDDHLSIFIRIIENRRDKDIYDLPDQIAEEYQLDLRRDGKALIYYEGLEGYREMGSREKIYIKQEPDEMGDPTFPKIETKQPVRFRLGDRLNQDGKFVNGYFEFHLFTQEYSVTTKAGIPKIEKNFLLRLYKIYPGYDTGAPTSDGLYPMIDPFTTG